MGRRYCQKSSCQELNAEYISLFNYAAVITATSIINKLFHIHINTISCIKYSQQLHILNYRNK
jgi:hypothetical protein